MNTGVWRFQSYISESDGRGDREYYVIKYDYNTKVLRLEHYYSYHCYEKGIARYTCDIPEVTKEILLAFAKGDYMHQVIERSEKDTDVLYMYEISQYGFAVEGQYRWHDWPKNGLAYDEWCSDKDAQIEHAKTNDFVRYSYHLEDPDSCEFRWNDRSYRRFRKLMQECASGL